MTKIGVSDFINSLKDDAVVVAGVTSDSRQVRKGYLFAALPGSKLDGADYIADAIAHGASYILLQNDVDIKELKNDGVNFIFSSNVRLDFSKIVSVFYKMQPENIVAVTGTSGKTSTVSFVQQLWHLSGITKCASLGTLGIRGPGIRQEGSLTTPDTETLHADLADLAAVGINHLALEASSHGLDQYRLDGLNIRCAAFTNLSRDHLDYHEDFESYFTAKARLFSDLLPVDGVAVLSADDEYFFRLKELCEKRGIKIISFGKNGEDVKLLSVSPKSNGQEVVLSVNGKEKTILLPLVGEFQVMNALCALCIMWGFDRDIEKYIPLLEKLRGVGGRLELVSGHPCGSVYVDYAHKPGALESVLNTLRVHTSGRLVCLFGCGGNRDVGKRKLMGDIAEKLADEVIVTDDNPRYEDPAVIRQEILQGAVNATEIAGRSQAIRTGVKGLQEGDVLVVAGKGHEKGQMVNGEVLPFNDVEEVKKAIADL